MLQCVTLFIESIIPKPGEIYLRHGPLRTEDKLFHNKFGLKFMVFIWCNFLQNWPVTNIWKIA